MLNSKKQIYRFVTVVIFILILALNFVQAQQPVFRVGVLDGEDGAVLNGARLAVQEINATGGVVGADSTVFQLELVPHATDDLPTAVANINQASVIAVVGPASTQTVLGGLATLQSLNVPVLTPAIGDTLIASDSSGLLFRTRAQEIWQGRALANYLVNDLSITNIVTVQLDLESTAGVVGFTTALSNQGLTPQASLLLDSGTTIDQLVTNATRLSPQVVVTYGPPSLASQLYAALQASGWNGIFHYNQTESELFRSAFSQGQLEGVLSTTTWAFSSKDESSTEFLTRYVQAYGEVPGPIEAASYDSIYLLAEAIGLPGDLKTNLAQITNFSGVQGVLSPSQLARGEMSNNVAVTRLGQFGAPQVVARFAGPERLPETEPTAAIDTPTPMPTPTIDGVVITIQSAVQNVRTGPSTGYDVIGQLQQGEQARVIGATIDFSWVVINFRGQNGWLFADLLEIAGDRTTVPIITPPPTPTPGPPTATPTAQPVADIVIVGASPTVLPLGTPFSVVVTVRNQGALDAGAFAVAATFQPGGVYSGVNLTSLAAGQQTTVTLTGTISGATGPQSIIIVADLNNQVNEGPAGEANNSDFTFDYVVDRPVLNGGTLTVNPGGSLNLEGSGTIDVLWNGTGSALEAQNGAGLYLIPNVSTLAQIYYDLIDPSLATTPALNVALLPNAFVGIVTAEGNRGVIQVNSVTSGGAITLTYRVYQSP